MACYLVSTNPRTHELITANLDRAPMFNGSIEGVGPRYCPSIEDKVVRFAHKESTACSWNPRVGRPTRSTCRARIPASLRMCRRRS